MVDTQGWTPFVRGSVIANAGVSSTRVTFVNNIYQVFVYFMESENPGFPPMIHLSIKTHDRAPRHDWRELQRIKNELCGTSCEAVELYPNESRLTDLANQYHLWVLAPGCHYPFGFNDGRVVSSDEETLRASHEVTRSLGMDPSNSKQRPFKAHHTSDNCPEVGPVWDGINYEWRGMDDATPVDS